MSLANVADPHQSAAFSVCDGWINSKQWAWWYCANGSWIGCKVFKNIFIIPAHHPSLSPRFTYGQACIRSHSLTHTHRHVSQILDSKKLFFLSRGDSTLCSQVPKMVELMTGFHGNQTASYDACEQWLATWVHTLFSSGRLHWQENVDDCCEGAAWSSSVDTTDLKGKVNTNSSQLLSLQEDVLLVTYGAMVFT